MSLVTKNLYAKVAKKILEESVHVKKGETLTVETWNTGLPFALEVVRQARRMGCIPLLVFEDEETYLDSVKSAPRDLFGRMGKHEYSLLADSDAYVFIPGPPIGHYSNQLNDEDWAHAISYGPSWYKAAQRAKLRGVRIEYGYVGEDYARYLGKTVEEVRDAQLRATLADFHKIGIKGREVSNLLADGAEVVVKTGSNRLEFTVGGDVGLGNIEMGDGIVDDEDIAKGQNMIAIPPGMVFRPVKVGSAFGTVNVASSLWELGYFYDVTLEFKDSLLVDARSPRSQKTIDAMLEGIPKEKRRLGNFSVGLNPKLHAGIGLDRFAAGTVGLYGFGITVAILGASLSAGGTTVVRNGRLLKR